MQNKLQKCNRNDKVKRVLTGILFCLAFFMLVISILQIFSNCKTKLFASAETESNETAVMVVDNSTLTLEELRLITGDNSATFLSDELLAQWQSILTVKNNINNETINSFLFCKAKTEMTIGVILLIPKRNVFDSLSDLYTFDGRVLEKKNGQAAVKYGFSGNDDYWYMSFGLSGSTPTDYGVESIELTYMYVDAREPVPLPNDPVKEGHTFVGWYYDAEYTDPYNGEPIFADTPLYAKFQINTYTVTFDADGGTALETQTVDWNTVVSPETSTRTGYTFKGWYYEDGTRYENQPIKENITLTARWEIKTFTVTFYVDGEVFVTKTVEYGQSLIKIAEESNLKMLSVRVESGEPIVDETGVVIVTEDCIVEAKEISNTDRINDAVAANKWAIIGGVCGGIVLIAGIAAGCVIGLRNRKAKGGKSTSKPVPKKTSAGKSNTTKKTTAAPVLQTKKSEKGRAVWGKIWKSALVVVLVAVLGVGAVGVTYICTDGFGGKAKTLIVAIGEEAYSENADGLVIFSGTQVRLTSLTGSGNYSVTVRATAPKSSFSFMVGEEKYEWTDVEGKDFTKGFQFENTAQGFKLGYDSLESILTSGFSESVTIGELSQSVDLFEMEIVCGNAKLVFGFSVGLPVSGVELDQDQIVI